MKKVVKVVNEKSSTLFLRAAIIGLALIVLGLCALILPQLAKGWSEELKDIQNTQYPVMLALSLAAIAFWIALYQGWKILKYIDANTAFSNATVRALKTMQRCSFFISGMMAACWPVMFYLAQFDDSPGVIIIYGIIFVGTPFVFAIALGVFQRLLKNVINIKSENDLTV